MSAVSNCGCIFCYLDRPIKWSSQTNPTKINRAGKSALVRNNKYEGISKFLTFRLSKASAYFLLPMSSFCFSRSSLAASVVNLVSDSRTWSFRRSVSAATVHGGRFGIEPFLSLHSRPSISSDDLQSVWFY